MELKGEDKVVCYLVYVPRWFDDKTQDNLYGATFYKTSTQHLDCDYYAVYHSGVSFDEEKLKQHTIIPFWECCCQYSLTINFTNKLIDSDCFCVILIVQRICFWRIKMSATYPVQNTSPVNTLGHCI